VVPASPSSNTVMAPAVRNPIPPPRDRKPWSLDAGGTEPCGTKPLWELREIAHDQGAFKTI
jgi:hypothetical protein